MRLKVCFINVFFSSVQQQHGETTWGFVSGHSQVGGRASHQTGERAMAAQMPPRPPSPIRFSEEQSKEFYKKLAYFKYPFCTDVSAVSSSAFPIEKREEDSRNGITAGYPLTSIY